MSALRTHFPPSFVHGGGTVWGDSVKDDEQAMTGVRDPPAPKSNWGIIWGSIWGGGSVRDDVSVLEDIRSSPFEVKPMDRGNQRIEKSLSRQRAWSPRDQ